MKVTHVVNAAVELPNYFEKNGLKYVQLDLVDTIGEENFISEIKRAY